MNTKRARKITMEKVMDDPRYRGYHVIVVAGKVFKARTGEGASKILAMARKNYPGKIPAITYIPDVDSLILAHLAKDIPSDHVVNWVRRGFELGVISPESISKSFTRLVLA